MKCFVERLAHQHSLPFARGAEASTLQVQKRALTFEVTIPDSVLEWLVVTNSADDILWQDWCDYYPLGMESAEQLAGDMRADLECFLAALVGGEFRIN